MADVIWLTGVKKPATGSTVGSKQCLDVSPQNTAGTPLYVSPVASTSVKESRFHDSSATTINDNGGAWVQLGGAAALSSDITEIQISANIGEPVEIGTGANAGGVTSRFYLNQGGDITIAVDSTVFVTGEKIWVRSLSTNSISSGYITANFIG